MTFCMIGMIALGLAMDAFAVSISNGVCTKPFGVKESLLQGLYFGGFQFLMPVIGWCLGSCVKAYIAAFDHWIALLLLACIGGNMLKESFAKSEEPQERHLKANILFLQAVATSIDALAVGIGFAILSVDILQAATIIGVISFVMACLGGMLGKYLGNVLQTKAEFVGGLVLIGIGLKIWIEHFFFGK